MGDEKLNNKNKTIIDNKLNVTQLKLGLIQMGS